MRKNDNDDNNNEDVDDISLSDIELDSDESNTEESIVTPALFVASMTGISQPQTLKMFGYIKNAKVIVLVDSGSTHNFIDSRVEKELNIFIYPSISYKYRYQETRPHCLRVDAIK